MNNVIEKNKCMGCTACMSICPKNAITMERDNEGFKYPVIDKNKCIHCNLCRKICPVINTKENKSINKCYVGYAKDNSYSTNSSSGGLFPLIADYILENNGYVIGAAFDDENNLKHIIIDSKEKLELLKGSKYVQSDLDSIFRYIKDNIEKHIILFTGTPCQVAGLKVFLKKDYDNLFCIDLICHGVPSPKLFKKHVSELEGENGKLLKYIFRDKRTGWDNYSNTMIYKNKTKTILSKNNDYMNLFLSNVALRQSCYNCNFKLGNKYSDITLGDFWGVKQCYPEMYNKDGVSAIIINTNKGKQLYDEIKNEINFKECKLEEISKFNTSLVKSSINTKNRQEFFKDIDKYDIKHLRIKYYKRKNCLNRVYGKLVSILKK